MRQQKGASPSKTRFQILNILIIHIEHKSYIPSALKYYNESIFTRKRRCGFGFGCGMATWQFLKKYDAGAARYIY